MSSLGSTLWAVRAGSTGGASSSGSTGDLLFAVAWGADFGGAGAGFSAAQSTAAWAAAGGHYTAVGHFYDSVGPRRRCPPRHSHAFEPSFIEVDSIP